MSLTKKISFVVDDEQQKIFAERFPRGGNLSAILRTVHYALVLSSEELELKITDDMRASLPLLKEALLKIYYQLPEGK